jgi:hypothetical protein
MSDESKTGSTGFHSLMKTAFGVFILILVFATCKKAIIPNTGTNSGTPQDTSSTRRDTSTSQTNQSDTVPASIAVFSGDNQIGYRGYPLAAQPTVIVRNKKGDPLFVIYVSFTPCAGCGSICPACDPLPTPTFLNGEAHSSWILGNLSDSIQSLTATVAGNPNLSVTFHATARDFKPHTFLGTMMIGPPTADSGVLTLPHGGITNLVTGTNMPLEMDSMSFDLNNLLIGPKTVNIINRRTINADGAPMSPDYLQVYDGIAYQSGGYIYNYRMNWTFTGTITNNTYSGTFHCGGEYFVTPPKGDVLRGGFDFDGTFSVTQQ